MKQYICGWCGTTTLALPGYCPDCQEKIRNIERLYGPPISEIGKGE